LIRIAGRTNGRAKIVPQPKKNKQLEKSPNSFAFVFRYLSFGIVQSKTPCAHFPVFIFEMVSPVSRGYNDNEEVPGMAGKTSRLFALSVLLVAGGMQALAETAAPPENVTVTGSRRVLHEFTKTFATPTQVTGKMARWERRLCPVVVGQNPHFTAFITQRVQYVALAVGAPVNTDASCTPNIDIVFTTTPQDLLDTVSKDDQHYLGYFSSVAQKKALATVIRPIQAWYATESTDRKGRTRLDTGRSIVGGTTVGNFNALSSGNGDIVSSSPGTALTDMPPFFASSGSRLNDEIHTGFRHILIVIDSTKLAGQDIVPLADYISMLALTQINSLDACQGLPSIVNRMASDCGHDVDGLTKYDLAYLQAVYHMTTGRNMVAQRGEIGDLMTDRLAELK
jgi:hypothetical protein